MGYCVEVQGRSQRNSTTCLIISFKPGRNWLVNKGLGTDDAGIFVRDRISAVKLHYQTVLSTCFSTVFNVSAFLRFVEKFKDPIFVSLNSNLLKIKN